ncbi:MAG: mechanosensitive ion channel [Candidatus Scalindua sp.]|jgi:small-conductance mechanosensitive channel|nr:mechanosensitive ion channel [Candidatus Scalindua sp.]MBT5305501.1 mechanosensitive ion channel [Candidatus Scalindua sp.]MBT6045341.1 mechanosensitive ion channel [Candidatus Scalindua sp.]MBT6226719.1 mechanosensitive ion channel [Candidatus Scalindua sp.]MBT6564344.1 mechanosensitive ion channel [Candidatus Scalindua sp.]
MFLCSGVLSAQTIELPKPQADIEQKVSEPEKSVAIPITKISDRAQETYIVLNKIDADLEINTEIQTINKQLPLFLSSTNRERSSWIYQSLNSLSTRKLQKLHHDWNMQLNKLETWKEPLLERSEILEKDSRQIEEMVELWKITGESAVTSEAPEIIQERTKSTLDQIRQTETKIIEQIRVLLTFKDQISEQELEITKLIGLIQNAEAHSRTRLFVYNSPPLWKATQVVVGIPGVGSQIFESWTYFLKMNKEYFNTDRGRCVLHIIIFTAFLAIMIYFSLRNRRKRLFEETDKDLKASAFFISCPFSTALLISVFFGAMIHINRPTAFGELITLLVLFPILRLVPGIFSSELKKPIYFLTGLCFLNITGSIVGDYILVQRLLVFLISILIIPIVAWWLRPNSQIYKIKSRLAFRLTIIFSSLVLFISLVSLVTNLIGISYLGYVLTYGMMNILYNTFGIYVIALVLEGFVVLLIRRRGAQSLHIVKSFSKKMERRIILFIHLYAIFFWLRMIFSTFGVSQYVWDWILQITEYSWTLGTIEIAVGAIFSFIIILIITIFMSRLVRTFLEVEIFTRLRLPRGVPGAISMLVRYAIIGIGSFLAISAIGIDLSRFGLLAGAMGVGLGFGLRNIIENFVSGLIIIFERPIELNDTVVVGDVIGNVSRIGIRSSTVKTFDGSEVIVPNANLITNQVTNWTMSDRQRRIQLPVKVAFGNDPHKVLELLHKVARDHPGVMEFPKPQAFFNGFGDNYLDFTLYYWVSDNILQTKSEMALGVHDTIKNAGIDTPRSKGDFNLKIIDTPDKLQNKDKGDKYN